MRDIADASPARPDSKLFPTPRMRFGILAALLAVLAYAFPVAASADSQGTVTLYKGFRTSAFIAQTTVGPDGNVWFVDAKTFSGIPAIGKITPSGTITEYISGTNLSGLNVGSDPTAIVAGPGGSKYLWFTDRGSTPAIGVIDSASPETVTELSIEAKGGNAGSKPEGITVGPDGNLWFTDAGTTPAIGKIKLSAPNEIESITEYSTGLNAGSMPLGITVGPDGNLWFTDGGTTRAIGKITPSGTITEFATGENSEPGGFNTPSGPWGIAPGADGNVWFTENGNNETHGPNGKALARITPSGTISYFSTGLITSSKPIGLTSAPEGRDWFTDTSGITEKQTVKFEGTWATGNKFKLCYEGECKEVEYTTANTTLRNRVKTALNAIPKLASKTPGVENVVVSCVEAKTCTISFEEGELDATNLAQVGCEPVTGVGTCATATIVTGVPNAVGSITVWGKITRYPIDGLLGVGAITYGPGENAWFAGGRTLLQRIGKVGVVPPTQTLTIKKEGSGDGTVTSIPSGIDCGATCSHAFPEGEEVELTAKADGESEFTGWTGCASEPEGKCRVTMSAAKEVTATFTKTGPTNKRTLTLTKSPDPSTGKGIGTVSSKPKGIKCAQTCTEAVGRFYKEQAIVLTAAPYGETSKFKEWKGACTGASLTCTIAAGKEDKAVEAVFEGTSKAILSPTALTLSKGSSEANRGYGTVKASGLTCESECDETTALYQGKITEPKVIAAKVVELKALAAFGSKFTGWSGGGCSGTEPSCKVTMDEAKTVTAEFAALPSKALTVEKAYSGGLGTVSTKVKGIKCGNTCTQAVANMPEGAAILLTAKAATTEPPSTFVKWEGGDCAGKTETTCTVTMDKAETVKAVFSGPVKAIANPQKLTLARTGTGSGIVKASGLACEGLCTSTSALYYGPVTEPKVKAGAKVILKATSAPGSKAVEWTGCASNPTPSECVVEMSAAKEVTAKFDELE